MEAGKGAGKPRIANVSGGIAARATSLAQLSDWCAARFGPHTVESDGRNRPFDIHWMVLDSLLVGEAWKWQPETELEVVLDEIARHAEAHPEWLELSAP